MTVARAIVAYAGSVFNGPNPFGGDEKGQSKADDLPLHVLAWSPKRLLHAAHVYARRRSTEGLRHDELRQGDQNTVPLLEAGDDLTDESTLCKMLAFLPIAQSILLLTCLDTVWLDSDEAVAVLVSAIRSSHVQWHSRLLGSHVVLLLVENGGEVGSCFGVEL